MASCEVKLEFRVWDVGIPGYAWRDYTTRYVRSEELIVEAESSVTGYRAYYPTLSKVYVDNSDRFWDVIERTSPELADGDDSYRKGLKGRLVRLTTYRGGGTDARNVEMQYVGAVANLTCQPNMPEAVIDLVSKQRLAMELKCDNEEIEGQDAAGDWWDLAKPDALYASRRQSVNGAYAVEWFRHKRAYQIMRRTKLPVTDSDITESIDNVRLTTADDRRTAVCLSLPASATLDPLGFCWGPASGTTAYVVMRTSAAPTDTLYLYSWDYVTGEIALVSQILQVVGSNAMLAWCGVNYNPNANKLYVCAWTQVGATGAWTPWLVQWDFLMATASTVNMQTWAAGLANPATTFHDFLFFTNCRGLVSGTQQGSLWVVLDTWKSPAGTSSNRIVEVACWSIVGGPAVLNDSAATYDAGSILWPARMALYPAACAEKTQADPNAAFINAALAPDIIIYITGATMWANGVTWMYHDYIWEIGIVGGAWAAIPATPVHFDAGDGLGICGWNELAETAFGLIFCRNTTGTIPGHQIVGKTFAQFGNNNTCALIEDEFWTGDHGGNGSAAHHNPDAHGWSLGEGSRFVYNFKNDRVYYLTAPYCASQNKAWNARLRSIDCSGAGVPSAAEDENTNPYVAGGIGDAVSDFAYKAQCSNALCFRYGTDYDVDVWELHGIVLQSLDAPVILSYAPRFYPVIPLVDLTGLSVWELRNLLAEICGSCHGYDSDGSLFFKERASIISVVYWPDGDLKLQDTGWTNIANVIGLIPSILVRSSGNEAASITQSTIGAGSNGALLVVHVGNTSDNNQLFRVRFTSSTAYAIERWVLNAWSSLGTATVDTTFRCAWFSLSPDCWAGQFVTGDSFSFVVYGSLYSLKQLDRMNRIEVRDATSVAKWGDQAVDIDNRFVARSQAIELLTKALSWSKDPHRRVRRVVDADALVDLNDVRVLVHEDWEMVTQLVGLRQKAGEPAKVLTFVEY